MSCLNDGNDYWVGISIKKAMMIQYLQNHQTSRQMDLRNSIRTPVHFLDKSCSVLLVTVSVCDYFCPKLFKSVQYDLWLLQLFLAFFNSLYQELSGYVSQISFVLYIYPQEVQELRLFCSFA